MKNKEEYFTPELEDFYVGYKFEFNYKDTFFEIWDVDGIPGNKIEFPESYEKHWMTHTYTGDTNMVDVSFDIKTIDKNIKDGRIRVPYLTKEQIVSEGWRFSFETKHGSTFLKDIIYEGVNQVMELDYNFENNKLTIGYDGGNFHNCDIFVGECTNINAFRKIQKLLKIK